MSRKHKMFVLRSNDVSREGIPETVKALKATQEVVTGLELDFAKFDFGFECYNETGEPWSP